MSLIEKIKISGITKNEFVQAAAKQSQKDAAAIFDKYNTDNAKSSTNEEYLDKKEQAALAKYLNEEKDQSKVKPFIDAFNKIIKGAKNDDVETIDAAKAQEPDEAQDTPPAADDTAQDTRPTRPQKRGLVPIAPEWKMQRMGDAKAKELKLHEQKTAQEVLDELVKQDKYKIDKDAQKDVLLQDLIRFNPSIFNEKGEVYSDALWDRLDFPENVKDLYAKDKKTPTVDNSAAEKSAKWFDKGSRVSEEKVEELKLKEQKESSAVLDALLKDAKIDESKIDKDKLSADFIAKNPSLFDKDGKVKSDANWTKLDFPASSIIELYGKEEEKKSEDIPKKDENPPKKGDNLQSEVNNFIASVSQTEAPPAILNEHDPSKAGQIIKNDDGTKMEYDSEGYVVYVKDANENLTLEIVRGANGKVLNYIDYEYDLNGNLKHTINRNPDGSLWQIVDSKYDTKGREISAIYHDFKDNSKNYFADFEYDASGKCTKKINHNYDGTVTHYYDYEYDTNGRRTREVKRNSDGAVESYEDIKYDANGNETSRIKHNSDGS